MSSHPRSLVAIRYHDASHTSHDVIASSYWPKGNYPSVLLSEIKYSWREGMCVLGRWGEWCSKTYDVESKLFLPSKLLAL